MHRILLVLVKLFSISGLLAIYRGCHNGMSTVNKENKNLHTFIFGGRKGTILVGKIISKVYTCFTLMGSSK